VIGIADDSNFPAQREPTSPQDDVNDKERQSEFRFDRWNSLRQPRRRRWRTLDGDQIMAGSVNKVILIGNLGADPEIRRTQDGRPIANLRLATSETWRDKASGERREKTEWHRVVIFNENLCRVAEQYLKKGSKVYLEGQLQTRKWTDQQGVERYTTEVVLQNFRGELALLDRAGGGGAAEGSDQGGDEFGAAGPTAGRDRQPAMSGPRRNELDDDIPF
jgi:single-strand DNA-binding protein